MGQKRRGYARDGEEKTNDEHCFARPSTAGPRPSRLNAVKLSSYSHKGNSLSQPVKYKRVFPAGRFSTPIVFWAGLLFSVALCRAARVQLADYYISLTTTIALVIISADAPEPDCFLFFLFFCFILEPRWWHKTASCWQRWCSKRFPRSRFTIKSRDRSRLEGGGRIFYFTLQK